MAKAWLEDKDPDEIRDYGVDWTPQLLSGVTITTSVWSVASGTVVIQAQSHTETNTTVRLTGGKLGEICNLLNTVTLSDGESYEQTCQLAVQSR
jgi:hypothetical protein